MYRSSGELANHAAKVFHYFTSLDAPADAGAGAVPGALDRAAFLEAYFVLFGYHPSSSLAEVLFPALQPAPTIDEATFLRFAQTVAFNEGHIASHDGGDLAADTESGGPGVGSSWTLFKALAGDKDYVVWDDLLSAQQSSSSPDSPWACIGQLSLQPQLPGDPINSGDVRRRVALLSHVFAMLDGDKDGRLTFSNLRPFLQAS